MKPGQSLTAGWLSQLPRERRQTLLTALALTGILGCLVLYGRWRGEVGVRSGAGADVAAAPPAVTEQAPEEPAEASAPEAVPAAEAVEAAEPAEQEPLRLQSPLAGGLEILQPYQFAFSPIYEDYRLHSGIDFAAAEGDTVRAAAAGTVAAVEADLAEGTVVVVDHGNGLMTRYAGLDRVTVQKGIRVETGSALGTVGRPAGSTQPYLHFEVLQDGEPVDPSPYLFQ